MIGPVTIQAGTLQAGDQQRLRVCLVSLHFAEYTLQLAQALSTRFDLLAVVYVENARDDVGQDWQIRFAAAGVQCLALPKPQGVRGMLSNWRRLRSEVRAFDPHVLHIQEGLRDEWVLALPWLRGIPMVLTVHDPRPHSGRDGEIFRFSRYRFYRWWARRWADLVLTHGLHLVEQLEQDWPTLRGRIQVVQHGPLGGSACRQDVSGTGNCKRLLFFGRIHAYKGLGAFVELVTQLHRANLPVLGVVAGQGADLELHRAAMTAAGCFEIRDRYIQVTEVDELFCSAHLVVLPYTDGTQSGVAALALGYARPVLATAVGSIPELVRDGVNGLLVAPGDADALARAGAAVVGDAELHATLCAGARTLADGELSWNAIANDTANWYAQVRTGFRRSLWSEHREPPA